MIKVSESFLACVKDCLEAYTNTLSFIEEEDEFMNNLRESRLYDCETLLLDINNMLNKEGK